MHVPRAMQLTRAAHCMLCMHSVRATHYTHVPHSSFQVDCTHGMHCTQAANGHRVRVHCTHCMQRICPGRDISTSTRSDLHPTSDTAFLPHRTSGRALQRAKAPPLSNAAHSYRYCTQHTQCMHQMRTVGLAAQPRRHYRPLRFTQQEINQCELRNEAINSSLDQSIARFD